MDISGLNVKELENLQISIAKEIEKRKQSGKADALKRARQVVEELGYTLEEVLGGKVASAGTKKPVAVKYRHPENNALTWTGRGKTPKWVSEWKAANGSIDGITLK